MPEAASNNKLTIGVQRYALRRIELDKAIGVAGRHVNDRHNVIDRNAAVLRLTVCISGQDIISGRIADLFHVVSGSGRSFAGSLVKGFPGDHIRPLGCGDRLLSDYFIDRKVDRPLRDVTPLVAVGDRVHWVIGHGISREAALVPGCAAVALSYAEGCPSMDGKHL